MLSFKRAVLSVPQATLLVPISVARDILIPAHHSQQILFTCIYYYVHRIHRQLADSSVEPTQAHALVKLHTNTLGCIYRTVSAMLHLPHCIYQRANSTWYVYDPHMQVGRIPWVYESIADAA
jgi:hypothetical protein